MATASPALGWPLVGRVADIERVSAAMQRRDRAGVVLAGPAGVGKTRLADECRAIAERLGFRTASIVATRAAASIPLGALAPLLPAALIERDLRGDVLRWASDAVADPDDTTPLLLVVDDAHLLDAASAAVVHLLAGANRAFVVASLRTGERPPDPVSALWKDGLAERIDLAALTDADVERLLGFVLGPVDGATRRDLTEASGGNPLVLRELVTGSIETGVLEDEGGIWRLTRPLAATPRLVELLGARLDDLPDAEREVLELLAVGEPVDLDIVEGLVDLRIVERLEQRTIVEVLTRPVGAALRLAHPMYGEVVRSGMTALRRMALSRRLADSAAVLPRTGDLVRVALWRLEGGGVVDSQVMLDAARVAFFAHDDPLAERLASAAVEAGGGIDAVLVLSQVLGALGRHHERLTILRGAADLAQTPEQQVKLAIEQSVPTFWALGRPDEAMAILASAAAALPGGEWRDELIGAHASLELLSGRPLDAIERSQPLLAPPGRGRAFVEAAIAAAPALAVIGRCIDAADLAARAFEAHLSLGDQEVLSNPGIHVAARILALGEAGALDEGASTAEAGYEVAVRDHDRSGQAWMALMAGRIGLLTGRFQTASRWFAASAAVFDELGEPGPRRWSLAGVAIAGACVGDRARAEHAIVELDQVSSPMLLMEPDVLRARAWHALVVGDPAAAIEHLHEAARVAAVSGSKALEAGVWHDVVRVEPNSGTEPARRLAALATEVDGPLVAARATLAAACAASSAEGFAEASAAFEAISAVAFAAEAAAAGAAALRRDQRGRAADREAQRAASLATGCEGVATPLLALAGPVAALTRREREIAVLAAGGVASKVIATRLGLSVRTVENHLQRAFQKLGVTTRADLADALEQT